MSAALAGSFYTDGATVAAIPPGETIRYGMDRNCENIAPKEQEDLMAFDPAIGRATQFRKGQSGNAGGRPKSRLLSEALRVRLSQVKSDDPAGRTYAEVMAANLIELACTQGPGAVQAANEVADRIEGRPTQSAQIGDFRQKLAAKSDEELLFHLQHDRWPTDEEKVLLSASSPHSTA